MGLIGSLSYRRRRKLFLSGVSGGGSAPPLLAGVKIATVGDSVIQYANSATASTIENQADSELHWALWRIGHRGRHHIWYDATNTSGEVPDRVSVYGDTNRVAANTIFFSGANFGYAGDTATGVAKRTTAVLNSTADLIIYNAGTNFGTTDGPVATVTAKITEVVNAYRAAGRQVIIGTIRPRRVAVSPSGSQISPASMQRIVDINAWIRANYASLGAYLWDAFDDLRDPAYPPGDPLYGTDAPGVTRDNVHLAPLGAWLSSRTLSIAITQVIGAGSWFNTDPTVSNILTNGRFTGTSGTANNGASGTVPTGAVVANVTGNSAFTGSISGTALTVTATSSGVVAVGQRVTGSGVSAGTFITGGSNPNFTVNVSQTVASTSLTGSCPVTAVVSLESNPDTGGQTAVIDITSAGDGPANTFNTIRMSFTPAPTTGFTSTDYVSAFWEVEAGASSIRPCFQATLGQSSTISARGLGQTLGNYNSEPYPTEDLGRGWVATEPLLVGSRTSLNPRFDMSIRADVAGTVRFKVRRAILRVVPNPVTEFPWSP